VTASTAAACSRVVGEAALPEGDAVQLLGHQAVPGQRLGDRVVRGRCAGPRRPPTAGPAARREQPVERRLGDVADAAGRQHQVDLGQLGHQPAGGVVGLQVLDPAVVEQPGLQAVRDGAAGDVEAR
jgi:hypothetical protein